MLRTMIRECRRSFRTAWIATYGPPPDAETAPVAESAPDDGSDLEWLESAPIDGSDLEWLETAPDAESAPDGHGADIERAAARAVAAHGGPRRAIRAIVHRLAPARNPRYLDRAVVALIRTAGDDADSALRALLGRMRSAD